MHYIDVIEWFNGSLALPSTCIFLGIAIIVTIVTQGLQLSGFGRLFHIIRFGLGSEKNDTVAISGFHALFTAMATAIGTGSIVAPSLAIVAGGPGALLWLIIYLLFGSILKYVEVVLAMKTRVVAHDRSVIGGPMHYLQLIHPFLAGWYGFLMLLLYFFGWQTVQSNTLAAIFAQESIPPIAVGLVLGLLLYVILRCGVITVGRLASYLVPIMFCLYLFFAILILLKHSDVLFDSLRLVVMDAFSLHAFGTASWINLIMVSMQAGVYRGIFISEAGLGTSSISHSVSNADRPQDQGLLALYSTIADIILSLVSGLLILVTGVWQGQTSLKATLIYEAFRQEVPGVGQYVLLMSITLFVFTTILGNGFNGMQIYKYFTNARHVHWYIVLVSLVVAFATLLPVATVWKVQDFLLTLAIIPHIFGLLYLVIKHRNWFIISNK